MQNKWLICLPVPVIPARLDSHDSILYEFYTSNFIESNSYESEYISCLCAFIAVWRKLVLMINHEIHSYKYDNLSLRKVWRDVFNDIKVSILHRRLFFFHPYKKWRKAFCIGITDLHQDSAELYSKRISSYASKTTLVLEIRCYHSRFCGHSYCQN